MRPSTPSPRLNGTTLQPKSAKTPKSRVGCVKRTRADAPDPAPEAVLQAPPPPPSPDGTNGKPASTGAQTADNRTDRDQNGRFVKGNIGGPGNPFGRRTASLRQAFCEAVTHEDLKTLAKGLLIQAQCGDVAAAKLVLAYAIGKPVDPVNPDTLDQQEFQLYQQTPTSPQDVHRILNSLPAGLACKLISILLPATEYKIKGLWLKKIHDDDKKEERRQKQRAARAARKSAPESSPEPAARTSPAEDSSEPAAQTSPADDSSVPAAQARVRPNHVNENAPQSSSQPPSLNGANGKPAGSDLPPQPPSRIGANGEPANSDVPPQPPSGNAANGKTASTDVPPQPPSADRANGQAASIDLPPQPPYHAASVAHRQPRRTP